MIKLSILIPSTHTRYNTFLPKIQDQIFGQYNNLSAFEQSQVEILILTDTKSLMLGEKRNVMLDMCQGKYAVMADDDDILSEDYIKTLLEATKSDADIITFTAMVSLNGGDAKPCYYSKDNRRDYNTNDAYYRIPNHICCVKKEVSLKSSFPNILRGEDAIYGQMLLPHLKTEYKIDKVLYYYNYSDETTETQQSLNPNIRRRQLPPVVDVVMLSNAKSNSLYKMTQNAIDSCIAGANSLPVNVIVMEQNTMAKYRNATTIHCTEPFNYNARANKGALTGSAEWVMISNNDCVFSSGWLHSLLIADHELVSSHCPMDSRQKDLEPNEMGIQNGRHFSGWNFMIKRALFNKIGLMDDRFPFWYADDSTIQRCLIEGVTPMIVKDSIVKHLGSTTLNTLDRRTKDEYTWEKTALFNEIYNQEKFIDNPNYQQYLRSKGK